MSFGLLNGPLAALQALVAASTNFQTLVGAANAAAALAFIHSVEANDSQASGGSNFGDPLPRAIVWLEPGTMTCRIGPGNWKEKAVLGLSIQAIPANGLTEAQEATWFLQLIESILLDLRNNSGGSDGSGTAYLNATEFSILNGPMPSDLDDYGLHFWGVDFKIETPN